MAAARGNDRGKMSRSLRARTRLSRGKILINAVIVGTRTIGTIYYIIYILIASRLHRNTMPRTCTVTTVDFPKKHGLTAKNVKPSHMTHRGPILPVPSSCIQLHVHINYTIDRYPPGSILLYYVLDSGSRTAVSGKIGPTPVVCIDEKRWLGGLGVGEKNRRKNLPCATGINRVLSVTAIGALPL